MSYMRHEAIVVTGVSFKEIIEPDLIEDSRERILAIEGLLLPISELMQSPVNNTYSYTVYSSGSNMGWNIYERCCEQREEIVKILRSYEFDDGSNPLKWVVVMYGDDNGESAIIDEGQRYFDLKQEELKLRDQFNI